MNNQLRLLRNAVCVFIFTFATIAQETPPLLLHYTFDEPSGDALDSASDPAAPAQLVGGATRSANTPSGQGFALDLTTDDPYAHLLEGDANKLDGLNQITLTTWLNVSTYTGGNMRLMAKQAGGAFGGFSWNMNAVPNDGTVGADNFRLGLFLGNNISSGGSDFGFAFSTADVETAADNWVFLAVTYDGSIDFDNLKFYVGGLNSPVVLLGEPQTIVQLTVDGGDSRFGVGFTDAAPTANTSVIGLQDDVRVYGGVLSLDQLEEARLAVAPPPAPLLHYTFDEPSGEALDSGSAPAAPAELVGGATRSANTPSGEGFSLDLTTDDPYAHLLEGDADKLDGLNQITLTTWLNVSTYTGGNMRLMAKQAGGAFGGFSWNMNAVPNDGTVGADNFRLGLFLGNNISSGGSDFGFAFSTADVETAANNWVFLAVTYDGTADFENLRFYVGGLDSPVVQLGDPQSIVQLTVDGGDSRFGVGFTDAAPTANTSVIGLQDDVRVYGSVLGLSDLDAIRQANVPTSPGRPSLEITRSGEQVIISWPGSATGFTLETTSRLEPGAVWSPVTEEVQTVDGRSTVTINPTDTAAFYRLRKP